MMLFFSYLPFPMVSFEFVLENKVIFPILAPQVITVPHISYYNFRPYQTILNSKRPYMHTAGK